MPLYWLPCTREYYDVTQNRHTVLKALTVGVVYVRFLNELSLQLYDNTAMQHVKLFIGSHTS
jgi:hypothetical protein